MMDRTLTFPDDKSHRLGACGAVSRLEAGKIVGLEGVGAGSALPESHPTRPFPGGSDRAHSGLPLHRRA